MLSKEAIIELILGNDQPRRLAAMVQEAFLTHRVFPAMNCKGISDGWFTAGSRQRNWYHFSDTAQRSDTDREILEGLHHDLGCSPLTLVTVNLERIGERLILSINETDGITGQAHAPRQMTLLAFPVSMKSRTEQDLQTLDAVRQYLVRMETDHLRRLLIGRLLMNRVYGDLHPVDIDAFYIRNNSTRWVLEYKRKWPMQGYYPARKNLRTADVRRLQQQIRQTLQQQGFSNAVSPTRQHVRAALQQVVNEGFRGLIEPDYLSRQAFGLDLSHATNVELCHRHGWGYSHLIWKARPPARLTDQLQHDLTPIHPELIYRDLEPRHFSGIAFTVNRDSGSFDQKTRLQLCINADDGGFQRAQRLHAHFLSDGDHLAEQPV